jgi:hypothetical protein
MYFCIRGPPPMKDAWRSNVPTQCHPHLCARRETKQRVLVSVTRGGVLMMHNDPVMGAA